MFESLKKLFKPASKEEERKATLQSIEEEMDEYDREINEYLSYVEERKTAPNPPPQVKQPEVLSKGGAIAAKSSLITPEEEKRILEGQKKD